MTSLPKTSGCFDGNEESAPDGLNVLSSFLFVGGYLAMDGSKPDLCRLPSMEIHAKWKSVCCGIIAPFFTLNSVKLQQATDVLQQVMDVCEVNKDDSSASPKDFYHQFRNVTRGIHLVNDENEEGIFMNEDIVHPVLNCIALHCIAGE